MKTSYNYAKQTLPLYPRHKYKYWPALLDMHVKAENTGIRGWFCSASSCRKSGVHGAYGFLSHHSDIDEFVDQIKPEGRPQRHRDRCK
jgi:hypothetical protein